MKKSVILYLLGKILQIEALLLLLPFIVGIIYQESSLVMRSYLVVAIGLGLLSLLTERLKPQKIKLYSRDGLIIVALGWISLSFFGALPLVLTSEIPNMFDAFFEITSGFTTTGSSILSSLAHLSHASLFWRSFTHLVGGMGVLVFTLAILPNSSEYVQLMRAEVPGPSFGKLVSRLSGTARILYGIYIAMTTVLIIILIFVKVPIFDAILLAFGTAGTGGFSVSDLGFAAYQNQALVEWIIAIGMALFGINFNIYYFIIIGYAKDILKDDEELKYYLCIILFAIVGISLNVYQMYDGVEPLLRNVFFTVSSIMTTTGYATADFEKWPIFSHTIIVALMVIGGCAGSTAGGLKVSRVLIYCKNAIAEIQRTANNGRIIVPKLSGKPISKMMQNQVAHYLMVYIFIFSLILLVISWQAPDFTTAFTTVVATFNNIGPGLGKVGPTENFSMYSNFNKLILSLGMIAGRLEIYPMIVLFSPTTVKSFFK